MNDLHAFERGVPKFSNITLERSPISECAAASVEVKMTTMQHKTFCIREFIKTESPTAVRRAFRLRSTFNFQRGGAFVVGITNLSK